jgi:archaellum component FlaC
MGIFDDLFSVANELNGFADEVKQVVGDTVSEVTSAVTDVQEGITSTIDDVKQQTGGSLDGAVSPDERNK